MLSPSPLSMSNSVVAFKFSVTALTCESKISTSWFSNDAVDVSSDMVHYIISVK